MTLTTRIKVWLLVGLTTGVGLAIGLVLHWFPQVPSESGAKPIHRLIRELRKQDTALDRACQSLWNTLPDVVVGRFPSLEPRPAILIRRAAALELRERGLGAKQALPALVAALNDADAVVSLNAIQALRGLGPSASEALPDLLKFFRNATNSSFDPILRQARGEALVALAAVAPEDPRNIALLREALKLNVPSDEPPEAQMRGYAVRGLEQISRSNLGAVAVLVTALDDSGLEFNSPKAGDSVDNVSQVQTQERTWFQAQADRLQRIEFSALLVAALGRIGAKSPEVLPAIIKALRSREERIQIAAVTALGVLGADAVPAIPLLIRYLQESPIPPRQFRATDRPIPRWVAGGLFPGAIVPAPQAAVSMAPAEGTSNGTTNLSSSTVAGALTKPGISRTDATFQPSVLRLAVIRTLGRIGPSARDAVPALIREYADKANWLRYEAAVARWRIDGQTQEVKAVLLEGMAHGDIEVRRDTVKLLGQLGVQGMPELTAALSNEDYAIRLTAIESLAALGPAAQSALPALRDRLTDSKRFVRYFAERALEQIHAGVVRELETHPTLKPLPPETPH